MILIVNDKDRFTLRDKNINEMIKPIPCISSPKYKTSKKAENEDR